MSCSAGGDVEEERAAFVGELGNEIACGSRAYIVMT